MRSSSSTISRFGGFVTRFFTCGQQWARHDGIRGNQGCLCRSEAFTNFKFPLTLLLCTLSRKIEF